MNDCEGSRGTVLAIDEHPDILTEIASVLHSAGYGCRCANDAQSAAEAIQQGAPDLIISDVNLSGHSGLAFCDELKRRFALREVPVMFLSAGQVPDIIRRCHAHGGTYHLRKPFDAPVLVELVEKARYQPHLAQAISGQ